MPGDERDDVGAPDDGRGQAKPPRFHDLDDVLTEFGIDLDEDEP
jgi:hypothetical protein